MTAKESMVEQDPNELPVEFIPSESDVICGWARQNYHHGKLASGGRIGFFVWFFQHSSFLPRTFSRKPNAP
jgi:hypothetical protein